MDARTKGPIGIELVKRGILTQADIDKVLEYQRRNPGKKILEILSILNMCDQYILLQVLGEILNEKTMIFSLANVKLDVKKYISLDMAKKYMAIPFEINGDKIKVCFSDSNSKAATEAVRLILLNKGYVMDKYVTFEKNIKSVLNALEGTDSENIDVGEDATTLVDSIIKTAMRKRASDIHIEPQEDSIIVRYRIDGELAKATEIKKEKQPQIIGRLKAISNMFQEKQESQDGRILLYPDYNIRVSSQKNIFGEKFVLRLLKKNMNIRGLKELGLELTEEEFRKKLNKRNSITIIAAPTGEGKTTTLYSIIDYLNSPNINITTIEDPVEIRIPGLNQIEISEKLRFSDSLRTVLRQDPDIVLVGEIRDKETAEIAMQAGQTGHYVLSTIHTIDSLEVITRLRKMGISNYDIASTLATAISQRLVRKLCTKCASKREFTDKEKEIIENNLKKYNIKTDFKDKYTYSPVGCKECNNTGFYERIGIFEILALTDEIKELIIQGASTLDIRQLAIQQGYRPLAIDGIDKVLRGITTLEEINKKVMIY